MSVAIIAAKGGKREASLQEGRLGATCLPLGSVWNAVPIDKGRKESVSPGEEYDYDY